MTTKLNKEVLKQRIIDFEMKMNGFYKLSGASVDVKNLRLTKTKVIADVILCDDIESKSYERLNKVEYPLEALLKA